MIEFFLNGETKKIDKQINLQELLERFDLPNERVAIELNKDVIRKKDWTNVKISDKDKIEIIHFVGGG